MPLPPLTAQQQENLVRAAIAEAEIGLSEGEAPIGAVIAVRDETAREPRIVARGRNRLNALQRKTAHAEMVAFENAGGNPPALPLDTPHIILASSLVPCVMCLGAAMESGVETVLFALQAPADNGTQRVKPPSSPESQSPEIIGGILAAESRILLQRWMETLGPQKPDQAKFVRQLLELTDVSRYHPWGR